MNTERRVPSVLTWMPIVLAAVAVVLLCVDREWFYATLIAATAALLIVNIGVQRRRSGKNGKR